MGFGSYDESEQGKNDVDANDDEESVSKKGEYQGEAEFEFGDADTEELLEKIED